jgi:hypothetical protein
MSAESVSPITTYFRVCDGVRVRFADTKADSDITVLMLAPWPESLWAFRRIWHQVAAVGRVVAIDLPGFGHSDGRPELIAPDASGAFLARLIDEWGLGSPHIVGPDVGTATALFLAARAPERVTSNVDDRNIEEVEELDEQKQCKRQRAATRPQEGRCFRDAPGGSRRLCRAQRRHSLDRCCRVHGQPLVRTATVSRYVAGIETGPDVVRA